MVWRPETAKPKICEICDLEYAPTAGRQRRCEDCQAMYGRINIEISRYLHAKVLSGVIICERCGKDLSEFIKLGEAKYKRLIHHKDGNHSNNSKGNHELLCWGCHVSHHWAGRPHTEEAKARIRAKAIGRKHTEESKAKMSMRRHSEETKAKMSASQIRGREERSSETKKRWEAGIYDHLHPSRWNKIGD